MQQDIHLPSRKLKTLADSIEKFRYWDADRGNIFLTGYALIGFEQRFPIFVHTFTSMVYQSLECLVYPCLKFTHFQYCYENTFVITFRRQQNRAFSQHRLLFNNREMTGLTAPPIVLGDMPPRGGETETNLIGLEQSGHNCFPISPPPAYTTTSSI